MSQQPTISVIVVTYNSAATIGACVESVAADAEVVIVDQCSRDNSTNVALRARPDSTVIYAGANRGFGAGCNLGGANASGDILIFLNPDALFIDGAAEHLASAATALDGMVGPTLEEPDGTVITKARRWSSTRTDLLDLMLPQHLIPRTLRRDIPGDDSVYTQGGPVPYVQGACMAVPRRLFDELGGFDERYFLYNEEESFARKLQSFGRRSALVPKAVVRHQGAVSTSSIREFSVSQYHRSRAIYYADRHGRVGGAVRSAALGAALTSLWVTAPFRSRLGYRKAETAAFCKSALVGLFAGATNRYVVPPR